MRPDSSPLQGTLWLKRPPARFRGYSKVREQDSNLQNPGVWSSPDDRLLGPPASFLYIIPRTNCFIPLLAGPVGGQTSTPRPTQT